MTQDRWVPKRFQISLPRNVMIALAKAAEGVNVHPKDHAAALIIDGLRRDGMLDESQQVRDGER